MPHSQLILAYLLKGAGLVLWTFATWVLLAASGASEAVSLVVSGGAFTAALVMILRGRKSESAGLRSQLRSTQEMLEETRADRDFWKEQARRTE